MFSPPQPSAFVWGEISLRFSFRFSSRFFFFHILHANRIFLNFNWIFDWLYLCLYTHISFVWIKTLDKFSPTARNMYVYTVFIYKNIYTQYSYIYASFKTLPILQLFWYQIWFLIFMFVSLLHHVSWEFTTKSGEICKLGMCTRQSV